MVSPASEANNAQSFLFATCQLSLQASVALSKEVSLVDIAQTTTAKARTHSLMQGAAVVQHATGVSCIMTAKVLIGGAVLGLQILRSNINLGIDCSSRTCTALWLEYGLNGNGTGFSHVSGASLTLLLPHQSAGYIAVTLIELQAG